MQMKQFTCESMSVICDWLAREIYRDSANPRQAVFIVPDPDLGVGVYAGATIGQGLVRHHSYKNWLDLAEYLDCRFLTPERVDGESVKLCFQPLDLQRSWHRDKDTTRENKYGRHSPFAGINKLEEPAFYLDYRACLKRINLRPGAAILSLGVNRGDELEPFSSLQGKDSSDSFRFTGIDLSSSAIQSAKHRYPQSNYRFLEADVMNLAGLQLGRFDLVLSIGTLQSPGIDMNRLLGKLLGNHLTDKGCLLFGFPNCRYVDGEIKYGARVKNYTHPELSLVIKDVAACRRYLNRHHFRVLITGKYYLFVTGLRIS